MIILISLAIFFVYSFIGIAAGAYWTKVMCDKICPRRCDNWCLLPGIPLGVLWPFSWAIVLSAKFFHLAATMSVRSGHKLAELGTKR